MSFTLLYEKEVGRGGGGGGKMYDCRGCIRLDIQAEMCCMLGGRGLLADVLYVRWEGVTG